MTMLHLPDHEVAAALVATDELLRVARSRLAKASDPLTAAARDAAMARAVEPLQEALTAYFLAFADRALPVVKLESWRWDPDDLDWEMEAELLEELLAPWFRAVAASGFEAAGAALAIELRLDMGVEVPRWIREHLATAIKDIELTTRKALQEMVATAIERGYSIEQLVRGVPGDGFSGLRSLVEGWTQARATTIALTESAVGWNMGAVEGYRASGLVDEVLVLDGVIDDVCAEANGSTWTLDEALDNPVGHPRCQRAFAAVVAR